MATRQREWLRVCDAALLLGAHGSTVRRWEREGKLVSRPFNARGDRRFARADVKRLARARSSRPVRRAFYVRVSGSQGHESSLVAQEAELRAAAGEPVAVFSDRGSGLNERRRGLSRLRAAAHRGEFDEVWVTYADRLTRFGRDVLQAALAADGVAVRVLHQTEDASAEQELMDDFMSLLASLSGRLYGQRSATARQRLLSEAAA